MTLPILAGIVVAIAVAFSLIHRNYRQREAERAEEYRKAAWLRGWHLHEEGTQLRYSGTTEGIPWTFVTARRGDRRGELHFLSRWHTPAVQSAEPVVVWSQRASGPAIRKELPDFARKLVFRPIAGFLGLDVDTLAAARSDPAVEVVIADENVPILGAVLKDDGLTVLVPTAVDDPHELEKIVRLGVRIARTKRSEAVF